MRQSLSQVFPTPGISPNRRWVLAPQEAGAIPMGRCSPAAYGGSMGISVWDQRLPRVPVRLRISAWRSRNWRRALVTWLVLSFALMAEAAHFPGPLCDAAGVVVAAVPVLLAILP
jgi:hypothetical protein